MEEEKLNTENEEQVTDEMADNKAADELTDAENAEQTTEAEPAEEKDPLDVALAEIEELKKQALYKAAEFDNYRKRTLKERAELILNGGEKVISTLLPVLDDMERAIENGAKTDDPAVLREGMELIYHKLVKVLEGHGVTEINAKGADFDTDIHEAVAMVPGMGDENKGKVIDCLTKGYKLNDKVIRHAKVAVGQ